MRLRSKKVLSMDFGRRNVKLVEGIFKRDRLSIKNTFTIDLPEEAYENGYIKDENALKESIDSFLKLNNIKSNETISVINSSDILTREIILPNVEEEEIDGILKYSITDYIPIEADDYIIQYIKQGIFLEDNNEKLKLLIIAMPKSMVEQHLKLLQDLNLKPKVLDFQGNAMRKFLLFNEIIGADFELKEKTVTSIDIGFSSTKVTILQDENIKIYRIIELGIDDILKNLDIGLSQREILESISNLKYDEAKDLRSEEDLEILRALSSFLSRLFESLEMVFRYYVSQEIDNNIDLIILQGDLENIHDMQAEFQSYFNIETVSINSLINLEDKNISLYSNPIGALIRGENI